MFGFGWVRTHLGDVFLRVYEFSFDSGWISGKKRTKSANIGNFGVGSYAVA